MTGLRSIGLYGPPNPTLETFMISSATRRCWSFNCSIVSCEKRGSLSDGYARDAGGATATTASATLIVKRISFFMVRFLLEWPCTIGFRTIRRIAGLPIEKQHPHVLKHSLASHLVAGYVNLALVRQALGHRSINSTMQYVGTSDGHASEAAQAALMSLF